MTQSETECLLIASIMTNDPFQQPGTAVSTALAYWPYWESVEGSKLAEAIVKCTHKGWRTTKRNVARLLTNEYKPWLDHPTFKDGLPMSCVEPEARTLLRHYEDKRTASLVATAHQAMLQMPQRTRMAALALKLQLESVL